MGKLTGFIIGGVCGWFIGAIIVSMRFLDPKFGELAQGIGMFFAFFSPDAFLFGFIAAIIGLCIGAVRDSRKQK